MPSYTPPFTVYWSTFFNAPANQSVDSTHQSDNIEAIYNIIKNSALTITDYAIYGIIAASWAVAGLNPARLRNGYLVTDPTVPTSITGYGLWMDESKDSDDAGYRETEQLITNVSNGLHYNEYINISLTDYLTSNDNNNLAWYWILNYVHYRYTKTDDLLTEEYQTYCAEIYDSIKQYITTNPRKINIASIALIKKRKKRWWM